MNEKFFDLKKEKQDRIINAALKVFAVNGYKHCSTDDIVKEAGISKGLLFHYFTSKLGLYEFLYDYCVRFLTLELRNCVSEKTTDYFDIMLAEEQGKLGILHSYPYMQMFIDKSQSEDDPTALEATTGQREELQEMYDGFLNQVNPAPFKNEVDPASVHMLLQSTLKAIMCDQLQMSFNADSYFKESCRYIKMLKAMSY